MEQRRRAIFEEQSAGDRQASLSVQVAVTDEARQGAPSWNFDLALKAVNRRAIEGDWKIDASVEQDIVVSEVADVAPEPGSVEPQPPDSAPPFPLPKHIKNGSVTFVSDLVLES
jgi:hypothetical protein